MGLILRKHDSLTFEKLVIVIHHIKLNKKNYMIIIIDVRKQPKI